MPGMRILADLKCEQCGREYYGDLQSGHGLYYPLLLEKATGEVFNRHNNDWFSTWLHASYQQRTSEKRPLTIEEFRPLRKVLLLNCLDVLYGHCLLKLLNAQYYLDHCPDFDLVVIVPSFLRWMVPEGVAAIWTLEIPLRRGTEWNDWLAGEIQEQLAKFDQVWVSVAYAHPHSRHFDIERFTRITPFDFTTWPRKVEQPIVTFIWRDDRRWEGDGGARFRSRLEHKIWRSLPQSVGRDRQQRKITKLAEILRRRNPQLSFAVIGPGEPVGFPAWIDDLRTRQIDEQTEHIWCEHYARSHVVIGVHGSNMLLPSAHAATMINLLPQDRLGNAIHDVLVTERDPRVALARYQLIPLSTSVADVAEIIQTIIETLHSFLRYMEYENVSHNPESFPSLSTL
jgi:hypothetical protein